MTNKKITHKKSINTEKKPRTLKKTQNGSSRGASSIKHSIIRMVKAKRDTVQSYAEFFNSLKPRQKSTLQYYKHAGYVPINAYLRYKPSRFNNEPEYKPEIHISKFGPNIPNSMAKQYREDYKTLTAKTSLQEFGTFVYKYFVKTVMDSIRDLDAIFAHPKVPKIQTNLYSKDSRVVLYRGVDSIPGIRSRKPGDMITMDDFISTSFNPRVSIRFMGIGMNSPDSVLFVMRGLQGQPYIFLDWGAVAAGKMTGLKATDYGDEYEYLLPRGLTFRVVRAGFSSEYTKYLNESIITKALDAKLSEEQGVAEMSDEFLQRSSVRTAVKPYVIELEFVELKPKPIKLLGPNLDYTMNMIMNLGNILHPKKEKTKKQSESDNIPAARSTPPAT